MTYGVYALGTEDYGSTPAWSAATTGPPWVFVEVAFTTAPGADPSWTDISDRFISATVNRGRQRELDRFVAGRARFTLANEDRALDPTYTSSPYYPNVLPMRRIRIRAVWAGVTYNVFSGYVDSWNQQYDPPSRALAVVDATDAFKVLANTVARSSAYAEEINSDLPLLWWRLGDPSGATVARESVSGVRQLSVLSTPTFGATSLVGNDSDTATTFTQAAGLQGVFPAGSFPWTTAATIEFITRATVDGLNKNFVSAATLGATNRSGVQLLRGTSEFLDVFVANNAGTAFNVQSTVPVIDGTTHHIAVTIAAGAPIKVYVDGIDRTSAAVTFTGTMANTTDPWIVAINAIDYTPFVSSGVIATHDEVALYTSALSPTRLAAHNTARTSPWTGDRTGARLGRLLDALSWPAANRNVDTGLSTLQAATLDESFLSLMQKVEETEQGALFVAADGTIRFIARDSLLKDPYGTSQATFGDSGTELEYGELSYVYDDQLIYNEVQVTRRGGNTQVVGNATSQAAYLRRTKTFDGILYQTDADAKGLADWWLTHYANPLMRATNMRLEPSAGNEATHFPQVLNRELMDRVTVRRRPQGLGSAIDQEAVIEGIVHNVTAMEWVTTWNLSPAETQIYWLAGIAGRGEAGVTTRAGF